MRPLRALLLLHFAWSTLQSSTGGELEEFLERRGDDSPVAHTDYDGSRRTPRSGPRGAEVAADGEPRNIMTAFEFNNLCADLENTRFDDDQEARLRRIICRRFGFGNEDGAGSQFGDGDDDADPDAEQNEIEDWMSQNAPEWDASLEPQLEDEEQLVLEIFEQEWDTDLDIWRRAYEMDDELREEQDLTSWADWWYYHFSGQPSRKEKGVYLLKNVVPVDGSYHFIKSYQLPSAWTVTSRKIQGLEVAEAPVPPRATATSTRRRTMLEASYAERLRTFQEREPEARRRNLARIPPADPRAVALARSNFIDLPRSRDTNYVCRFPTEIHTDDERLRRKEDGDLYEAWRSDPDALGLAQPAVGNKWIKVPDSFGDGIDMNPAVLMGLAGADGSYWAYENQGETKVSHRFAIKMKNSAGNVRLLSAAKQLIGSGEVYVMGEKQLGYYVRVSFECRDKKCIKFLADYWRLAGPRAFQCQLAMFAQDVCKIGSRLRNLPQHVTDAQDMYMAALAAAKKEEPLVDTPEAVQSYYELATGHGEESFLEMLLGFLIGDGGAYVTSTGYKIGLYQSHRAFLVGWSQALERYRFGALSMTQYPITKKTLGNRVVESNRPKYKGVVVGEAACRRLARALVAAAERRGLLFDYKVRALQMMRDRPFSQDVFLDYRERNAEEAEAAEAEEGNF